jgi:diacylglycerol kinase (ATP)
VSGSWREIAVLFNPSAGKGLARRWQPAIIRRLTDSGCRVQPLLGSDAADSARLTADAVAAGVDALVVVGGDGLVHEALQHAVPANVPVGIVPTGSGNDLARDLLLPTGDALAAVDVVIASHTRRIDLGWAAGRYFATVLASGFDSRVSERAYARRWPHGQLRYTVATLAELAVFEPIPYTLVVDGEHRALEAMLVAVGNSASYGAGLRMCHGARLDDGALDVVIIKPVSKRELVRVYPRLYTGGHVTHPRYERVMARRVSLSADAVVAYADGERLGALPLEVQVVPAALTVFTPPPHSG